MAVVKMILKWLRKIMRNKKLTGNDVVQYCKENDVKVGVKAYGKDGGCRTVGLIKDGMWVPLSPEANDAIYEAVVTLMVSEGIHARLNS